MKEKKLSVLDYKCRILHHNASGLPIVFLHGLAYTSDIWQRLKITDLLIEKKIAFLAIDMPYGIRSDCKPKTRNPQKNVSLVHEAVQNILGTETPVIVGASMGGNIALHYAANFPVKGLLLIAPVRVLDEQLTHAYPTFRFPVKIIWGTEDNIASGEDLRTLSDKLPNAKLVVYNGAGHSAYKDRTDRFKQDLLELYVTAEQA